MTRSIKIWFAVAAPLFFTGCSSRVSEAFKAALDFVTLNKESSIILISNSTAEKQAACISGNSVTIQKSFPAGRKLFCRDKSKLSTSVSVGEVCPGGVSIVKPNVSPDVKDCATITLCGVAPSGAQTVGQRTDGGLIDQLKYGNLPWGCDVQVDFSFDPQFADDATSHLKFYVQPPDCPFCPSQNKRTCLACRDLSSDETIKSGQVIKKCTGNNCAPCEVLGVPGQTVPHAGQKLYFMTANSTCQQKCAAQSLLRTCNDGLWAGDPAYAQPQCADTNCGCNLPNDPVTYAHNSSLTVYSAKQTECGIECSTVSLAMSCKDGQWYTGAVPRPVTPAEIAQYSSKTCAKKLCNCARPDRDVVADGQTKTVYSQKTVTCAQKCSDFSGGVTCTAGMLKAPNPNFLNYAFDACAQEDCGCKVPIDGATFFLIANGGSAKVYQYSQNTVDVPDACTNPAYQVALTCTAKNLTPTYDAGIFKFRTCTTVNLGCTFTDGDGKKISVDHNGTLPVSKTALPECGVACENLTLKCDNTVWKKSSGASFVVVPPTELAQYKSATACTPRNCDCNVNGNIIPFGKSDPEFYTTAKAVDCDPAGCTAAKATLTCTKDGPTSSRGDDPKKYVAKACEVVPCGCPLPWGGTIDSGRTIKVFAIDRSTCQEPLACQSSANFKSISCTNGSLTPFDAGTFKFNTCSPEVCTCAYGNRTVPFNATLKVYKSDESPANGRCDDISTLLTCHVGGTFTGADTRQYPYTACTDLTDDGIGGGSGGGTGNDEGPGSGIRKRVGLGDGGGGGGGGPCLDLKTCRTSVYDLQIRPYSKKTCLLPWGGGEAEHFSSVAAFDTQCATLPDKCSQHRIVRRCGMYSWSGDDKYKYPACAEKSVCP